MSEQNTSADGITVLHLSAIDHGGAGSAALRLHQAMLARGVNSHMLVWQTQSKARNVTTVGNAGFVGLRRFLARAWYRITSRRSYFFRYQRASCVTRNRLCAFANDIKPQLIVVHYISDFLSFSDVLAMHRITGARVVFHLLDMGLLTGGCHYGWGCRGYKRKCTDCPALPFRPGRAIAAVALAEKIEAVRAMDAVVVVPSYQLSQDIQESSVFAGNERRRILIGANSKSLGRHDLLAARAELGLEAEGIYLFFGAQHLNDPRKGLELLITALRNLDAKGDLQRADVHLLIAGPIDQLKGLDTITSPIHALGYVGSETLALAYCASDFFICPSIEDSGPMMVNEAMMSGTPVIGFPIGVLPDLVINGKTGLLANTIDAEGLRTALSNALVWNLARRRASRRACRALALAKCSLESQVEGFLALATVAK